MLQPIFNNIEVDTVRNLFRLLSRDTHLRILLYLVSRGRRYNLPKQKRFRFNSVKDIEQALHLPQSTVSTALNELEKGALIECQRQGKHVYSAVKTETVYILRKFINRTYALTLWKSSTS